MFFSNSSFFGGFPLVDPRWVIESLTEAGYNPSHIVGKANSMTLPRGINPGLGWVLMQNADYEALAKDSVHKLQLISIGDPGINKLVILGRESITAGPTLKNESVVMVHIADVRHIGKLLSGYFDSQSKVACNIHTPDYKDELFYQDTAIDSWPSLIAHLFTKIPAIVPRPDLTYSSFPEKKPQGYDFQGWSAWEALRNVLETINHTIIMTIAGDLLIVAMGDSSTLPDNALDAYNPYLHDDTMYTHNPSAYLGASTVTHFESFDFAFFLSSRLEEATPKTYRRHRSIRSIASANAVGTPVFGGTFNHQQAALKALYTHDGVPTNALDLEAEADRQAEQVSARANKRTFHRIYKGWHNIPVVFDGFSSISWFDYGIGMNDLSDGGAFTEICILPFEPPRISLKSGGMPEYYSPGKHPGPPDLATPHIETEYLCVARPAQTVIVPGDARDTFFRYGTLPAAGPQVITWHDSAAHHTAFHNISRSRVFIPGENYPGYYHQQVRKWLLFDGEQIVAVRAGEFLEPGRCCNATVGYCEDGIWLPSSACILQDAFHRNFLAPGEAVWAKPVGTTSDGVMVCECIGENGLQQVAKVKNDVECGSYGLFLITVKTPDTNATRAAPDLKISDKTGAAYYAARKNLHTFGGCGDGQETYEVTACPEQGTTRKLFKNEYVPLKYVPASRRWEYRPKPQNLFAVGILSSKMCQNGNYPVLEPQVVGDNCTNIIGTGGGWSFITGDNLMNLKGKSGDTVYMQFDGVSIWEIVQVKHHTQVVVENINIFGCLTFLLQLRDHAVQYCDDPEILPKTVGEALDVITGVHVASDCDFGILVDKANVTVLCINGTSVDQSAVSLESIIVVTDVYDDGENIVACFAEIFVPCIGDEWCEPVIPTERCEDASGSGS